MGTSAHIVLIMVLVGDLSLVYVSIEDHLTNIFAESLGTKKRRGFKGLLGILEMEFSLTGCVEISSSTSMHIGESFE